MARAKVPSEREIAAVLIAHGIVDFVSGGRLTYAERKVLWNVLKKLGPPAARGAAGFIPAVARTAGMIALRHPYVAAGAAIYVGVTEREKIRALLEQGYDIIEERIPTPSLPPSPGRPAIPGVEEIITQSMARRPVSEFLAPRLQALVKRPRKPSAFNRAVSAGMKVVKKARTYGGKGKIKPAKKAFALVTKLASAKKKKKKAPKSGIRRRIWNAMKGLR
jgi:hypothetical protein